MHKDRTDRPYLAQMIADSPAGKTFLVPAILCRPALGKHPDSGRALRVLFGLLWLSADVMRGGVQAVFRASLPEVRIACGYEGYCRDTPVIDGIAELRDETCDIKNGEILKIFERICVCETGEQVLEWVFTQEFIDLFVSPRTFAIASILDIANLKSGLDFFLYLQVRRVWKMRMKSAQLSLDDLAVAAGLSHQDTARRTLERVRRTAARLEALLGGTIAISLLRSLLSTHDRKIRVDVTPCD